MILPVKVHSVEEVQEFSQIASILLVNVGTLSSEWLQSMKKAVAAYNEQGKLWVLDPVAAGGTQYRTKVRLRISTLLPIARVLIQLPNLMLQSSLRIVQTASY